jgi:hypothetical protein
VEKPKLVSVSPKFACLAQEPRAITFTGEGFYSYNANSPNVTVSFMDKSAEFSAALQGEGVDLGIWRQEVLVHKSAIAQLKFETADPIKPTLTFEQPVPEVDSAHFASQVPVYVEQGCTAATSDFVAFPPPVVEFVQPRLMCLGSTQRVVIGGRYISFLTGGTAAPATGAGATTAAAATTAAPSSDTTAADSTTAETTAGSTTPMRKRQATTVTTTAATTSGDASTTSGDGSTTTAAATDAPTGVPVTLAVVGADREAGAGKVSLGAGNGKNFVGTECDVSKDTADVQLCTQATADIEVSLSNSAAGTLAPFVVTGPEPIGCASQRVEVAVVERAKIEKMEPFVVFAENGDVPVKLTGTGFLRFDGAVPSVRFQRTERETAKADDGPVAVDEMALVFAPSNVTLSECAPVTGVAAGIESCKVLEFVVAAGTKLLDTVDLIVTQPEPLDTLCGASIETALLPSPKIDSHSSGRYLVCAGEQATYKLNGLFYRIGGADPRLLFNGEYVGDSEFNQGMAVGPQFHVGAQFITAYSTISLDSGPGLLLGAKQNITPSVSIDIEGQVPGLSVPGLRPYNNTVMVVPNMATTVAPFPGLCASSGNEDIEFRGGWFIMNGATLPSFELNNTATGFTVTNVGACTPLYGTYQICSAVRVSVPITARGDVQLRGPGEFNTCTLKLPVQLQQVSRATAPTIVEPSICVGAANQNVTLRGTFPLIGEAVPNIALNNVVFGGGRCVTMSSVTTCTEMTVPVDPDIAAANALTIGYSAIAVAVRVSAACVTPATGAFVGVPTGIIQNVTPKRVCGTKDAALSITGQALIKNGTTPSIELAYGATGATPQRVTIANADIGGTCMTTGGANLCTTAGVTLPASALMTYLSGNAEVPLEMSLISRSLCASPVQKQVTVVPLPVVVGPIKVALSASSASVDSPACVDQSYVVTIVGNNFVTASKSLRVDFRHVASGSVTSFTDGVGGVTVLISRITIPLAAGALPVGRHTVVVSNGGSCDSTPVDFVVDPLVNVIVSEPRALPPGLLQPFLLRNTGVLRTSRNAVSFSGQASGALSVTTLEDTSVIQCSFPSLPAPGNYSFTITTDSFCNGTSATALLEILPMSAKVPITTDTLFFSGGELVVRSAGVTFAPATRLYLRNNASSVIEEVPFTHVIESGSAVRGFHETFDNAAAFEIFFVDPTNRRWGSAPFATTTNRGTADAVVPGTVAKSAASAMQSVVVRVSDSGIMVQSCTLLCQGSAARTQVCMANAGIQNTGLGGLVTVTFERQTLVEGEVCRVRLASSNSDVTSQPFAVVPETNVASAATVDTQTTALKTPRSAACAATAETVPRNGARPRTYVHVIGGRSANGTALRSVEVTLVSATSSRLDFTPSSDLVTATSQCAATTYSGYVYAIGNSIVQRARILSAVDAPTLVVYVSYAGAARPVAATGTFSYAVAYTTNADGDSLPSNIGEVFVPRVASTVRLNFTAPSGVVVTGWKVFRSKDGGALQQLDVAGATATSYVDTGATTPSGAAPLAPGAVGKWQSSSQPLASANGAVAFTNVQVGQQTSAVLVGGTGATMGGTVVVNLVETMTGFLLTPGGSNTIGAALPDVNFVRVADGFDSSSGLESELWTVFGSAGAYGAEPKYEPSFTQEVTPSVYSFNGPACGAAGAGKVVFVGGSEARMRVASYTRSLSMTSFATIGSFSTVSGPSFPQHDSRPACARVAGKLLVIGGTDSGASSVVTTFVI